MSKEEFYELRDNKYKNQNNMLELENKSITLVNYFPA
jgi:hypothetical protein